MEILDMLFPLESLPFLMAVTALLFFVTALILSSSNRLPVRLLAVLLFLAANVLTVAAIDLFVGAGVY